MQSARVVWEGRDHDLASLPGNLKWRKAHLQVLPKEWAAHAEQSYVRALGDAGFAAANVQLRELVESVSHRLSVGASDDDVRAAAERAAHDAWALGAGHRSLSGLVARLEAHCQAYGVPAPAGPDLQANARRMLCGRWWVRNLRRAHARRSEGAAIAHGMVHRRGWLYVSEDGLRRREDQRRRNHRSLSAALAESDEGDAMTLATVAGGSVANPEVRRAELMARIRGMEEGAREAGLCGEFWTLTAPSKFHRMRMDGRTALPNERWEGALPRDTQGYLSAVWARIRAAWARAGIQACGLRVAEPHHDGTPHWHLLLFIDPSRVDDAREIFAAHALRMDGREPGAGQYRCKFVTLDWRRGSAAGYVAKYVAKNIDGRNVAALQDDEGERETLGETAPRVDAWAATWGIRQFQQVGGAPVGVWRELRRIPEPFATHAAEVARLSADVGEWRTYQDAMGGPFAKRGTAPVMLARSGDQSGYDVWVLSSGLQGHVSEEQRDAIRAGALPDPVESPWQGVTVYGDAANPPPIGVMLREPVQFGLARILGTVRHRSRRKSWVITWGVKGDAGGAGGVCRPSDSCQ